MSPTHRISALPNWSQGKQTTKDFKFRVQQKAELAPIKWLKGLKWGWVRENTSFIKSCQKEVIQMYHTNVCTETCWKFYVSIIQLTQNLVICVRYNQPHLQLLESTKICLCFPHLQILTVQSSNGICHTEQY